MQISKISFKATLNNTPTTNKFMSQFSQKQQEDFVNILAKFGSEKDTVEVSDYSKIVDIYTQFKAEYGEAINYPITEIFNKKEPEEQDIIKRKKRIKIIE